ncbi:MAG TPA: hypothetical protein VF221_14980, partial [Chloroflexota bacterium]
MLPSTSIVVPTYWTREGGERRPGDAVYDHPTPVGTPGTLGALLESLDRLDTSQFFLVLLVAVTADDAAAGAERSVRELVGRHPGLRSLVFGPSQFAWLHQWLSDNDLDDAASFLALRAYPKIRNLQLVLPLALGASSIVALDDDEIVTDPNFLSKAVEPLGKPVNGGRVDGLSGHYEQDDGSIFLKVDPAKASSSNLFDRKATIMNAATEMLERESGNLVPTPVCFGGNMEFTAELAASVGFDPGITRGEDIDYLINARMEGRKFFLRKDLRILHCPPAGGSYKDANISKLEQDVIRFLYEREKLHASQENAALHPVTPDELMPYPGEFLQADLETQACEALEKAGLPGGCGEFIGEVASGLPDRVSQYLRFRTQWPSAVEQISGS